MRSRLLFAAQARGEDEFAQARGEDEFQICWKFEIPLCSLCPPSADQTMIASREVQKQ